MDAIIISSGHELISGQTIDTNSAWLSRELARFGIHTLEHCTVGDDRADIAAALTRSAGRADLVVMTGGLGPTEDDLGRHALADAMGGAPLVLHEPSMEHIRAFFRKLGRAMCEANNIQAMCPRGAEMLENAVGTAPGIAARLGDCQVFLVPGVPSEMRWIFEHVIAPRLPQGGGVTLHRTVHTFGQGESDVGSKIADLMRRDANPLVGTTVAAGMVSVRIIARAATLDEARAMADDMTAQVRGRLGAIVIGQDDETMAAVVGQLLRARGQTLATAESCTGGMVGELLTAVPGSSDYYRGGVVTYSNELKTALLGVDPAVIAEHGAVSEPVARAMAAGCRQRLGGDWAISVTGIAGPGGGSEAKPVGLVFTGLAAPDGQVDVHRHVLPGTRDIVRLRASLAAMNYLRLRLNG